MNARLSIAELYAERDADEARAERAATLDVMGSLWLEDRETVSVRDDAVRTFDLRRLSGRVIA